MMEKRWLLPPLFCMLLLELRVVQGVIKSTLLHELIVVALFDNGSVLDNKDGICILNRRQSVRYDEAGFIFHQCAHSILYLYFGA